jgi:trigger factor
MHVELETLEGIERRIRMTLPMAPIDSAVNAELKNISRRARLNGFRPGKAPLHMIAQQYGAGIRLDVIEKQINEHFSEAVQEKGLDPIGSPHIEDIKEEPGQVQVSMLFEVYPEIRIGDLSHYAIEKPILDVTEAEVDKTLEILRKQRTRYEPVERPVGQGDRVIIGFIGRIDGEVFEGGTAEKFPFVVGAGQMLPDFEAGLMGMSKGEQKTVQVVFPADYHGKEVAGKTADFTLTVHEVSQPILPELDENFAEQLGVKDSSIEVLRAEIKDNLIREVKRRLQNRVKQRVFEALKQAAPSVSVPKTFLAQEIKTMSQEMRKRLKTQGVQGADTLNLDESMFMAQASDRVMMGMLMSHLVKEKELSAKPEQVRALIEEWSQSYEDPQEMLNWFYESPDRLREPQATVMEQNVVDYVLSQVKVNEVPIDFNTLMENI